MSQPRYNGIALLSQMSGLSQDEVRAIARQVKENQERLNKCPGPHLFAPLGDGPTDLWLCATCGGSVSRRDARWYQRGIEHGGRNCRETER